MLEKNSLHFDPDRHAEETLKSLNECVQMFDLRYKANFPDPLKISMDAAIERWKLVNEDAKPTLQQYDSIKAKWQSKDKVAKVLGLYCSKCIFEDFKAAIPAEAERDLCNWPDFLKAMRQYYKPTVNSTLKNFQFRSLNQAADETFTAFCNRIVQEVRHCSFNCESPTCSAEETATHDQIIIGLEDDFIREEALKHSWSLRDLQANGMRLESASRGAAEIAGDSTVNKLGKYSYRNMKDENKKRESKAVPTLNRDFCGNNVATPIKQHIQQCQARSSKCSACGKMGHYARVCKSKTEIREVKPDVNSEDEDVYNICIFRITSGKGLHLGDFKAQIVVNNCLDHIFADTGAHVSVCCWKDTKRWGIHKKMQTSKTKIKPYNSPAIRTMGIARCTVTFGRSVPVIWHIIEED